MDTRKLLIEGRRCMCWGVVCESLPRLTGLWNLQELKGHHKSSLSVQGHQYTLLSTMSWITQTTSERAVAALCRQRQQNYAYTQLMKQGNPWGAFWEPTWKPLEHQYDSPLLSWGWPPSCCSDCTTMSVQVCERETGRGNFVRERLNTLCK